MFKGVVGMMALCWPLLATPQPFTLGTEAIDYYPHYGWQTGESRELSGFARELFDRFATRQGTEFHYELLPVKRLYQRFFSAQSLDFKYPDAPEWQSPLRQPLSIHYSEPVIHYVDGVVTRPDTQGLKKLGTIRGFTPVPYLTAIANGDITLTEFARVPQLLQAVLHRRIDGAYVNIDVALYHARHTLNAATALCFNTQLPSMNGDYRLATLKHKDMLNAFNAFLVAEAQWVQSLKKKYGFNTRWPSDARPSAAGRCLYDAKISDSLNLTHKKGR